MAYRPSRWYDPYPRLAFAFQLLGLVPEQLRRQVLAEWGAMLDGMVDCPKRKPKKATTGNRPYDGLDDVAVLVDSLRYGTDGQKAASADHLLRLIGRVA